MELDGVVALGGSPVAYVRNVDGYDVGAEDDLQRRHWLNGTAPLLLIVDQTVVRAYSSKPRKPGLETGKAACVQVLDRVANAHELQYLLEKVRTGSYFREHPKHFRRANGVDSRLLRQLRATRDALWNLDTEVGLGSCHSLIVRVLILRYFSDRGLLDSTFFSRMGDSSEDLHAYLRNGSAATWSLLANVFGELAERLGIREFNDTRRSFADSPFQDTHFDLISRFLRDDELESGQLTLGAWRYDLSLLPVELISAVYQEFIYDEVPNAKRDIGLVPTPRFLAEIVLNQAFDGLKEDVPRVLDPACGSGIFLVGCFNRLAHTWRLKHPRVKAKRTYNGLKTLLAENIAGVELEPTACELARLNLLHALLSQITTDHLKEVMEHSDHTSERLLPATNVIQKDFFTAHPPVAKHQFDLVVGNPPWSNNPVLNWDKTGRSRPVPQRGNLVYYFAWTAADYLKEGGQACLLLDGKAMLFAPAAHDFFRAWFEAHDVDLVVNLAAFRSVLFKEAGRAAAIFRFRAAKEASSARIRFVTPWVTGATSQGGLLDLGDAKIETIRAEEIRACAKKGELPKFFRPRLFGSGRDLSLVERLRTLPSLREVGWIGHQGFNRHGSQGPAKKRDLVNEVPFLPTSMPKGAGPWAGWLPLERFTREYGESKNEVDQIRQWPADERIFRSPRVIMHQTPLQEPCMFRAAWTRKPFTFHKEIRGVFREGAGEDELRLLAGLLMSEPAYYFFFHTSLSWGVEAMPQVRHQDVLDFPWPDLSGGRASRGADKIIAAIKKLEEAPDYAAALEETRRTVSDAALDVFSMDDWERDLVSDCMLSAAAIAFGGGRLPKEIDVAGPRECEAYVRRLTTALASWSPGGEGLGGQAFISKSAELGVVLLRRGLEEADQVIETLEDDEELSSILNRLRSVASKRYGRPSAPLNLMLFDGQALYITKPLGSRHWTLTAALNDADLLVAQLMGRND